MRVLVTGSNGFIGQHIVDELLKRGDIVQGLAFTTEPRQREYYYFTQCDILDYPRLHNIFATFQPDAVVHLAAKADIDDTQPVEAYAANIQGVENICQAIETVKTIKRAVFTSTQLVCRVGYRPKNDTDYAPSTHYGASKVKTEEIVRARNGGNTEWCLIRPTTVWGPGMNAHYQRFFRMIKNGRYFHVGRQPRLRHMGYVGNVTFQIMKFLECPTEQMHTKMFYVADYEPISVQAWANALQHAMGAAKIRTMPAFMAKTLAKMGDVVNAVGVKSFPFNSFRLNNVLTEYQFDMKRTQDVCGPLPVSLQQGAEATAKWFATIS